LDYEYFIDKLNLDDHDYRKNFIIFLTHKKYCSCSIFDQNRMKYSSVYVYMKILTFKYFCLSVITF